MTSAGETFKPTRLASRRVSAFHAAAAIACIALLGGCVSLPKLLLPTKPANIAQTTPVCPGSLRADVLPQPPVPAAAGFPAAETDAESAAVTAYLSWLHDLALWGRQGWARAADARAYCNEAKP